LTDRVVSARFPYLPLDLSIGGRQVELEGLLDTGLDGDLLVPSGTLDPLVRPSRTVLYRLVDGSPVFALVHDADLQIGSLPPIPISVASIGSETLVGRGVSDRYKITLDHGQRLVVEG
jgi:predicted aspartyl protease